MLVTQQEKNIYLFLQAGWGIESPDIGAARAQLLFFFFAPF
jgi:hypothetical protein